jgi:hypothetical protein
MTPWIALSLIVAFYLLGPLFWGIRGAIICFLLPPATSLLIGIYILVHGTNLGASKFTIYPSWLATVGYVIAGSFGGPYLFVGMVWMIGFPIAAVGLWLHGKTRSATGIMKNPE